MRTARHHAPKSVPRNGPRIGENALASLVSKHLRDSADVLATRLRKLLDGGEPASDLTLVVLKRRLS